MNRASASIPDASEAHRRRSVPDCAPHFIIIGAMKCGTSTLREQLAAQPGVFMTTPKEPQFFSDDEQFARGEGWYRGLFEGAATGAVRGEASTHYTKLPDKPRTVDRMRAFFGDRADVRFVYVMRRPLDRLVSHYIHAWTMNEAPRGIDEAVDALPGLVDYGRYSMQLRPYVEAFGFERVLPVFLERMHAAPGETLERVGRFVGASGPLEWREESAATNVSAERLRRSPLRDLIVNAPLLSTIRRRAVPRAWREKVKALWRMNERPALSAGVEARVVERFDEDLATLGEWLGTPLSCAAWKRTVSAGPLEWAAAEARRS